MNRLCAIYHNDHSNECHIPISLSLSLCISQAQWYCIQYVTTWCCSSTTMHSSHERGCRDATLCPPSHSMPLFVVLNDGDDDDDGIAAIRRRRQQHHIHYMSRVQVNNTYGVMTVVLLCPALKCIEPSPFVCYAVGMVWCDAPRHWPSKVNRSVCSSAGHQTNWIPHHQKHSNGSRSIQ